MSESYDVIVIGAGHNGLVNAAYLARARERAAHDGGVGDMAAWCASG